MNNIDAIIDALATAVEMEKTLQSYYKHASRQAKSSELATKFDQMEEAHMRVAERLELRREALQHENGETFLGDAIESIAHAIRDVIAGLPVGLIHTETNPTISFFRDSEEKLCVHYESLMPDADPKTVQLLEEALRNAQGNLQFLEEVDR